MKKISEELSNNNSTYHNLVGYQNSDYNSIGDGESSFLFIL
jgi:hypothetical protein